VDAVAAAEPATPDAAAAAGEVPARHALRIRVVRAAAAREVFARRTRPACLRLRRLRAVKPSLLCAKRACVEARAAEGSTIRAVRRTLNPTAIMIIAREQEAAAPAPAASREPANGIASIRVTMINVLFFTAVSMIAAILHASTIPAEMERATAWRARPKTPVVMTAAVPPEWD